MSSRTSFLVSLALSLSATLAPSAHAIKPLGGGSAPQFGRIPVCSNPPSLTQCASKTYVATCNQKDLCLRVQTDAAAAKRTTSLDATTKGTLQFAYVDPYKLNVSVGLPSLSFEGEALPFWLAAQKAGAKLAQAIQPMHAQYEANGQAVTSCEEYAYQKYYDLNRYQDALKALGTDWWSIVDLTFMPSSQGPGIAYRTLNEFGYSPPRPSYNQIFDPKFVDTSLRRKNAFFFNDLSVFKELTAAGYGHGLSAPIVALLQNPNASAYKGGNFTSSYFAFAQARAAEHRPGGAGSAPLYSDAAYRAMAIRRAQYAQITQKIRQGSMLMLDADNQLAMDLVTLPSNAGNCPGPKTPGGICEIADPNTGKPYVTPHTIDEYWPPAVPVETEASPDAGWLSAFETANPMGDQIYGAVLTTNEPMGGEGCGTAAWYDCNHDYAYAQGIATKAKYEYLLARFIEAEFGSGRTHGCLNTASSACDWSPRDVALEYGNLLSSVREYQYSRCVAATGNNFAAIAYKDFPNGKGLHKQDYWFPPADAALGIPNYKGNYTWSTDAVDQFIALYQERDSLWKQYQDAEQAVVGQIADLPVDDGAHGLVAHSSDHHGLLDFGAFGASYSYDMGWQVTSAETRPFGVNEQRICRLAGTMHGSITGDVSGLGKSFHVFDAGFDAAGTPWDAHSTATFNVAGNDVFAGTNPTLSGAPDAPFSVSALVAQHGLPDVPLVDQWFLLLDVVPVHLYAAIGSSVGMNLGLGVNNPGSKTAADGACDFENVTYAMHSTLEPWAKADLVGQAAVDVGFADAGVRVTLNLLTVGVPFSMGIDAQPTSGKGTAVAFSDSLDVNLGELGGDVELFADINALVASYHAKAVLFSWEGFHQKRSLWNQSKSFPLDALSIRLFTPGMQPPAGSSGGGSSGGF